MNINTNAIFFLELQAQLKICHWQTKSYARHIAFGETYDSLQDLTDKFIEVSMGKYGKFKLSDEDKCLNLKNISEIDIKAYLNEIKSKLIGLTQELGEKDTDLANIKDEMLADINKLSFLLTLE
jgi:hypothetical protein